MGRRFNEKYLNHARPEVSAGMSTVVVGSDNLRSQKCPLCSGEHFRRLTRIMGVPRSVGGDHAVLNDLAFVEVMACRACGWIMENAKISPFLRENGTLRPCDSCGCEVHEECFAVATVSRMITGTHDDKMLLRQVWFCARCGKMFEVERRGAAPLPAPVVGND